MATTLEAIQARMKRLQAQADARTAKGTAKVMATIRQLMEEHERSVAVQSEDALRAKRFDKREEVALRDGTKRSALAQQYVSGAGVERSILADGREKLLHQC